MSLIHRQFFALNTAVEGALLADDRAGNDLFDRIELRVRDFEKRFSRFVADSELAKLNDHSGQQTAISQEALAILTSARLVWERTDGLINPLIGQTLIDAGYDDSFERLNECRPAGLALNTNPCTSFDDVTIDKKKLTVAIPKNSRLDFGGIGKGFLVDALMPDIEAVTKNYWFSLGGDLVVSGIDETGRAWQVGVQKFNSPDSNLGFINPPAGRWGIATSSTTKRRGTVGSRSWHHIIDPRTGRPTDTDVIGATVLATSTILADAFAKVVILLGAKAGIAWIQKQPECEALVITTDQAVHLTNGMKNYFAPL